MNLNELFPRCKWMYRDGRYRFGWLFSEKDDLATVIDVKGRVDQVKRGLVTK
jgi:hypothetical protein